MPHDFSSCFLADKRIPLFFSLCSSSSNLSTDENVNSTPLGKRDLTIEVPELRKQQSYPLPLPPNSASRGQERTQDIVESPGSPWKKGKYLGVGLLGGVYLGFNRWAVSASRSPFLIWWLLSLGILILGV